MHRPVPCRRRSGALTRCVTRRGSTGVPRGRQTAAAWQDCAVRLSTFPHPRASTAVQWLICAFIQIVHRSIHRSLRWLARGWRDRSKLSGWPWGPAASEGGLWPGDSAVSPASGALSHKPATRPATICPLTGTRPCRAGPATPRRGLGAQARERARHRAVGAPDWHRVRRAGPGTRAGWQLRSIGRHGAA